MTRKTHLLERSGKENQARFLVHPSIEMIDSFIKELGITGAAFETYYGLPKGIIKRIRYGEMKFPRRFWHIIYLKIVPQYGIGFNFATPNNPTRKKVPKYTHNKEEIIRLGKL